MSFVAEFITGVFVFAVERTSTRTNQTTTRNHMQFESSTIRFKSASRDRAHPPSFDRMPNWPHGLRASARGYPGG